MSRTQQIFRNILSNWTGFAAQAAIVFFLTPFVLDQLGGERYGLWVLAMSITGHYGLLALGLHGSVGLFLTRSLAARDFERLNATISTAFVILVGLAGLLVIATFVIAFVLPNTLKISASIHNEVFWCLMVVGLSTSIQFALFPFSTVFVARQRFDVSNAIGVSTRVLGAALTVLALNLNFGLPGIAVAMAIADLSGYLARWMIAYRILPELRVKLRLAQRSRVRELLTFGGWSFLISIANSVFQYVDVLVISAFMPLAAVTPYALAAGLTRQIEGVLAPAHQVFFPAVTELHTQGKLSTLREVYITGSRTLLVLAVQLSTLAALFAEDFYRYWVGDDLVRGDEFTSVVTVFFVLLGAVLARYLPGLGGQILHGALRVKSIASVAIIEAVANLLLSAILIRFYGILRVAIATLVCVIAIRTFSIPILVAREVSTSLPEFLVRVSVRPLIVAAATCAVVIPIRHIWTADGMTELLFQGVIVGLLSLPGLLFLGLTVEERQRFVYRPLASLSRRRRTLGSEPMSKRRREPERSETTG